MKCFRLLFGTFCMNRASVFEWHKRFKEGSLWGMMRCGRSKEVNSPELISYRVRVRVVYWGFKGVQEEIPSKRLALFKSSQWYFHQDNAPVDNSILVTDYLTKMNIKTVPHRPYSPGLASCDFWLFPKLTDCCYETIEEMKKDVTKVNDTLIQEDFHGTLQKLLERYNKCKGD